MARQSTNPVTFAKTRRTDTAVGMSSGRAGVVQPVTYAPLLRGDSASGRVSVSLDLAEMPKPLLNAVVANFQAWFVPKSAYPKFTGQDEFMHSYQGDDIKSIGGDRTPPPFFDELTNTATIAASDFFKALGLHIPAGTVINADLIDAFNLIYNFRLAAHSSRLERRKYATEDLVEALTFPRAFWPTGRLSQVVPDYERALIIGALDLDVSAGRLPISGISRDGADSIPDSSARIIATSEGVALTDGASGLNFSIGSAAAGIFAEMEDQAVITSLADIDKARVTQAFAKLRTAYAGNDITGYDNDDTLVAELMQGFRVPDTEWRRPWLLDSRRVPFGMAERFATDSENLDVSVTQGVASATLSINVPANDIGGLIVVTVEVLPERLDEAMSDEFLHITNTSALPDALRDIQRTEPVDIVTARRVDARHTTPDALYGYEPMNNVWNREYTRLGGVFYQPDPENPFTESRSGIWQTGIVDPQFTADHWLAPEDFPHNVFADANAPAFELNFRQDITIVGITQVGDVLAENNDDYEAVKPPAEGE